jgi:hypothetical protein
MTSVKSVVPVEPPIDTVIVEEGDDRGMQHDLDAWSSLARTLADCTDLAGDDWPLALAVGAYLSG